jgi:hypothetical protein
MKTIIALLFLSTTALAVFSQTKPDPVRDIQALKDGVLLVRLPTGSAKIAKLQELIEREESGSAYEKRLQEELVRTRTDTERQNRVLVQAFRDIYKFSDAMFFFDTSAPALKAGNHAGIFLDDSLQPDPGLSLDGRFYLVAAIGVTQEAALDDALIVYDAQFDPMPKPFPYYSDVSSVELLWRSIGRRGDALEEEHYRLLVERLNRKFFRYHKKIAQSQ